MMTCTEVQVIIEPHYVEFVIKKVDNALYQGCDSVKKDMDRVLLWLELTCIKVT